MGRTVKFPSREDFNKLPNKEKTLVLISAASLAPSTVNTQPWIFKLKDNTIGLFLNKERVLPVSDPTGREAYISLGACWENLETICESYGIQFETIFNFQGSGNMPIGKITFHNLTAMNDDSETRKAITKRHTNRFVFQNKELPKKFIGETKNLYSGKTKVSIITDDITKEKIATNVINAVYEVFNNKQWSKELSHWIKPSLSGVKDGMPGYYLGIPKLISFILPFILRNFSIARKQRITHQKILSYVPAYGILTAPSDTTESWFFVGKTFEKIALKAEMEGIKTGIFTAPIALGHFRNTIKDLLGTEENPQMLFRLGYTDKIPQFSPRLPLSLISK